MGQRDFETNKVQFKTIFGPSPEKLYTYCYINHIRIYIYIYNYIVILKQMGIYSSVRF